MSKLYRVCDYAFNGRHAARGFNISLVRDHGWLWTYVGIWEPDPAAYKAYKSVATGSIEPWADCELEEVE